MAWIPAAIGAAGAIGSALASNSGKKGSSSQTNTVSPADWTSLGPGAIGTWDDFINQMYGGKTKIDPSGMSQYQRQTFDTLNGEIQKYQNALSYLDSLPYNQREEDAGRKKQREDYRAKIAELQGMIDQQFPESQFPRSQTLSLQDKMNANYGAQEKTGQNYIDTMGGVGNAYKNEMAGTTSNFQNALNKISANASKPFMNVNIGGNPLAIVSKRQLGLANVLSDLANSNYKSGVTLAGTNYDVDKGQADRVLNQGMQFTPYGSDVQYFDKLWPIVQQLQSMRYQTPSNTQTATSTVGTSFAEKMNNIVDATKATNDLLSSLFRSNNGSGTTTDLTQSPIQWDFSTK